jgi:hypothetical protein
MCIKAFTRTLFVRTLAAVAVLLLAAGCGRGDGAVGGQCTKNRDCREGLRCLEFSDGTGACSSKCSPGSCPGDTRCIQVRVHVTDPGCNRTYTGELTSRYCIPHDKASLVEPKGRVSITLD